MADWHAQRLVLTVAMGVAAGAVASARVRAALLARPGLVVAAIVAADVALLLWAATPFVPNGVDESYFAIGAHALHGANVVGHFARTPLPVVAGALVLVQPALPGILLKQVATVAAWRLADRTAGTAAGLVAAALAAVANQLASHCASFQSEPYGAATTTLLPLCAAAGPWWSAAAVAGLGAASRWQLAALVPLALWAAHRRGPKPFALPAAAVLAALPVLLLAPLTGADPLRTFGNEASRPITVAQRALAYLSPASGFGLGPLLPLALGGAVLLLRRCDRTGTWVVATFATHALATIATGDVQRRYHAAAVPLGAVLVAVAGAGLAAKSPLRQRPRLRAALLAALLLVAAVPLRAPRTRAEKLATPQAALAAARDELHRHLGSEPLWTDHDVLAVTAVLGHPCRAVLGPCATHPDGVDLTFDGTQPLGERAAIPAGAWYLTFAPAERPVLWRGAGLALVRW